MIKSTQTAFVAACFAAIAQVSLADQPVHCLKSQVAGYWTFNVSDEAVKPDLNTAESICTHELPNKVQIIDGHTEFKLPGNSLQLNVLLDKDFTVKVLDGPEGAETGEVGHWTIVYDQSIVVKLPDRDNARYTANFRYTIKDEKKDQKNRLSTQSYDAFDFICSETMVGVKLTDSKYSQCWFGIQDKPLNTDEIIENSKLASAFVLAQTSSSSTASMKISDTTKVLGQVQARSGNPLNEMSESDRILLAQIINEAHLSWTADSYSSQTGNTLAQTSSKSASKTFNDDSDEWHVAADKAKEFLDRDFESISLDEMPTEWDWQDVDGYNFTPEVKDQGSCGSCYLLATNAMLESRIRIWFGVEKDLSVQNRLDCNYLNEGCHGGWGYFDNLYLEQHGAIDASCGNKYTGSLSAGGCSNYSSCDKVAGIKDTYYVGDDAYGRMNEQDMIKELRVRGPLLYDFQAGGAFGSYKSGVLKDEGQDELAAKIASAKSALAQTNSNSDNCSSNSVDTEGCLTVSSKTQETQGLQWEHLTHSTLIIGYGQEGEDKFWLVRNSYGANWGDNGNFKVRRGHNDFGSEGEASAATPILYDN